MPEVVYPIRDVKLKHFDHDGRARFITFSTHQNMPILTNNKFRQAVLDAIDSTRKRHGFRLIAYVIMPEHVHLVIIPKEESKVGQIVGDIKCVSARSIHSILKENNRGIIRKLSIVRNEKTRFSLWKPRCYDHNCRSEESLWQKVVYCHYNPVKRGLVREPDDFPWSNSCWYAGMNKTRLSIEVCQTT